MASLVSMTSGQQYTSAVWKNLFDKYNTSDSESWESDATWDYNAGTRDNLESSDSEVVAAMPKKGYVFQQQQQKGRRVPFFSFLDDSSEKKKKKKKTASKKIPRKKRKKKHTTLGYDRIHTLAAREGIHIGPRGHIVIDPNSPWTKIFGSIKSNRWVLDKKKKKKKK